MECKINYANQEYVKKLEKNINKELKSIFKSKNNSSANSVLLNWGKENNYNDLEFDYVCNPAHGLNNIKNRLRMFKILKLNGIEIPPIKRIGETESGIARYKVEKVNTIRNYRVFVFQFNTVIMYRSNDNLVWLSQKPSKVNIKYFETAESENRETQKVAQLAQRAVYSLGLDFGSVWIGVTSSKKNIVLNVDSAPILNIKREKLFRQAIVSFIEQYNNDKLSTNPVLGADPEFMFKDNKGKMILASKYFSKNGSVGCDARTINRNKAKRPLGEIRPEPSSNPQQLLENIRNIMAEAVGVVNSNKVSWVAGSMPFKGYAIGGHIHFSNVKLNTPMVRVLDSYLALPLALIENPVTAKQRRPRYGFLGDVRTQFHGGFEYRTLSSWVVCPKISKAVLYLSHFLVKNYTKLKTNIYDSYNQQRLFYNVNRAELKSKFNILWDELEQIPGFLSVYNHIKIVPEMIEKDVIWDEKVDFIKSWNINSQKLVREAKSS
ncbi:putative amidoligase domain-containing protein [Desulfuribacillus alkaliarsenatis]|uniref:Phage phiEco32-like COOH-NH2 ligase-type 2 n=1 Tax=Desulfuribacillus alkaliarsenatis TaxID=766136 RepID=A0A1E5FZQ7_9FIRM|nr:hypothetical protein [Desulfuribacillus alkaliarsenatis]OEF96010.1 hypothetical protein BHF68_09695 [Desulfuribacillus alkaliarsenatis]